MEAHGESEFPVSKLVDEWRNRNLQPDDEYQRGARWSLRQKQMLVDSVFRAYPLPRFYFLKKTSHDVEGTPTHVWNVIDGQQRLIALTEFVADKWTLFKMDDPKVALPNSIKNEVAPWAGKRYSELEPGLQDRLDGFLLSVVIVDAATSDEVRDLFIRLQAGTPLTSQQVRDAWPGALGPFIENLAGKIKKIGTYKGLLATVDRRGSKSGTDAEDRADDCEEMRQTCAQLFLQFLDVELGREPGSLAGRALNDLYHEYSDFDLHGDRAERFLGVLKDCQNIMAQASSGSKKKYRKITLLSLAHFVQDLRRADMPFQHELGQIADRLVEPDPSDLRGLRPTSGAARAKHYRWFRDDRMGSLPLQGKDKKRVFDQEQKEQIWKRCEGKCQVCGRDVPEEGAEYDHIKPHALGGQTTVSNGRLVHSGCHQRGLAALSEVKSAP